MLKIQKSRRTIAVNSESTQWTGFVWTKDEYVLAEQLMRKIRVLPRDWSDDIVQELLLHPGRIKNWRGQNYKSFLFKLLLRSALDVDKHEFKRRAKEENRPKEFLDIEKVLYALKRDTPEHSVEWQDLILRSALRDKTLTEQELQAAGKHCCECRECFVVFRRSDAFGLQPTWWVGECRGLPRAQFALVVAETIRVVAQEWKPGYSHWLLPYVYEQGAKKIRQNILRGVFGNQPGGFSIGKNAARKFCIEALDRVDTSLLPVYE
jgi:hypothetical protein